MLKILLSLLLFSFYLLIQLMIGDMKKALLQKKVKCHKSTRS